MGPDQTPLDLLKPPESVGNDVISACKGYLTAYLSKEMSWDEFVKLCLSVAPQRPNREDMAGRLVILQSELKRELAKSTPDTSFLNSVNAKISYWETAVYSWDFWHAEEVKYGVTT